MQETASFFRRTRSQARLLARRQPGCAGHRGRLAVFRTQLEVTRKVFSVRITDKETKPAEKTRLLYLPSEKANRKKEIEDYYNRRVALSSENLADQILSNKVPGALRLSLKASTGQKLKNSEIANALAKRLFRENLVTDDLKKTMGARAELPPRAAWENTPVWRSNNDRACEALLP